MEDGTPIMESPWTRCGVDNCLLGVSAAFPNKHRKRGTRRMFYCNVGVSKLWGCKQEQSRHSPSDFLVTLPQFRTILAGRLDKSNIV